jgi:hypothetical protein
MPTKHHHQLQTGACSVSTTIGLTSNRVINSNTDNNAYNRNFNPFSSDLYCIYGFLPSTRHNKSVRIFLLSYLMKKKQKRYFCWIFSMIDFF